MKLRKLNQRYTLSGCQGDGKTIPFNVSSSDLSLAKTIHFLTCYGIELMSSLREIELWTLSLLTEQNHPIGSLKIKRNQENGSLLVEGQVLNSPLVKTMVSEEMLDLVKPTVPINSAEQLELDLYPGMP